MQLVCPCLNVQLQAVPPTADPPALAPEDRDRLQDFFSHAYAHMQVLDVSYKLPKMVVQRQLSSGSWLLQQCPICRTPCLASGSVATAPVHLVSRSMISAEKRIAELRESEDYAPAYGIVLPKKENVPPSVDTGFNEPLLTGSSLYTGEGKDVISDLAHDYLRSQKDNMEKRIREYCDKEKMQFDLLSSKVMAQRSSLLNLLQSGEDSVPVSPVLPGTDSWVTAASASTVRQKSFSNPVNMQTAAASVPKRKHHSGGASLGQTPDEEPLFCIDEDRDSTGPPTAFSTDDEAETDDSGTAFDFGLVRPTRRPGRDRHPATSDRRSQKPDADDLDLYIMPEIPKRHANQIYGTSLPVGIPQKPRGRSSPSFFPEDLDENQEMEDSDLGAKIRVLAESVRDRQDPERLFGDRPDRRRWRTGMS